MCTLILLSACGEELTVQVEGAGKVTSTPAGIDCGVACRTKFDSGSEVQLTVQPASGSIFTGWGGACQGQKETCTIKLDGPTSVTVALAKLHRVEIQKRGDGRGVITSDPPGIDCGTKCGGEFAANTKLAIDVKPEMGVKVVEVGACGSKLPCTVDVRAPLNIAVVLDVVPGALLTSERMDDEGGGAFTVDDAGNAIWSKEQRLETFAPDGKRLRRVSLANAKLVSAKWLAARPDDVVMVAGESAESAIVAGVKTSGDTAWSVALPGKILGAGAWSKGSVVALAIDDKVQIGEHSYGAKKKNDVVMVWIDDAGKISDSISLKLPITGETAAFTVDPRGAGIIAVKVGKKYVLAKQAGSEGQSWNVKVGELERAYLTANEAGDVWLGGTALSLDESLKEAGGKVEKSKSPCADTGFGFLARFDAAGQVQAARVLERGIAGFGLDTAGNLLAAVEFIGDISTSTGSFTSAGFAAKISDCDQTCVKDCGGTTLEACDRCKATCAAEREASLGDALCSGEPDVLIGLLTPAFDFTWARQLSPEGELSIEGFGVSKDGLALTAAMSSAKLKVLGGANETTVPAGVSLLVFR
jgi:hypothetical protein